MHKSTQRKNHLRLLQRMRYLNATKSLLMIILSLSLWSCVNLQTPAALIVEPTPPTTSPTFSFPTLIPSTTPTSELMSTPTSSKPLEIGETIYREDFDSDQEWDLRETERGGSSIYNGRLNLAVRQPSAFFFIRTPAPEQDDFYLEVSLRSEVCEEGDEFGMMYRLGSLYNHYRFALTCEGLLRVTRINEEREIVLVPSTQTYVVYPGLRVDNRLAVWASGSQFRFLVNSQDVFTIQDDELASGGFGLFVRSRRSQQTTVSFEFLLLREIQPDPASTDFPETDITS